MPETFRFLSLDDPAPPVLVWTAAGVVALFGLAIAIEVFRRYAQKRQVRRAEWAHVRAIAEERQLNEAEWRLLRTLIARFAPNRPLEVATTRRVFDQCVHQSMQALQARTDLPELEREGVLLRDLRRQLGLDYVPIGQRIHSTRELFLGQQVWVGEPQDVTPKWYQMRLSAVDEAFFHIAPVDSALPPFSAGDQLRFRMWREEDARYVFTTAIVRVEERPATFTLQHCEVLKRVQARAFYRVRHDQATDIDMLALPRGGSIPEHLDRLQSSGKMRGRITSISGGGCAVVVLEALPPNVLLRIQVEMAEEPTLTLFARIVDTIPLSGGRFLVRCAFSGITDEERDTITRHVFRRQQLLRSSEKDFVEAAE
ncbi:MAG: PilZ domain-containing protein [Candidatus Hydrogenedentes bacterium]|nr:PilZ domain-containing protein [Candidatus Hydrogenedentota bacterium]